MMPISRALSLVLLLVGTATGANAGDWVFAGTNEDGTWFVDRESVEQDGVVKTYWYWAKMHNGTSNLARVRMNCATKVFQIFNLDGRDVDGHVVYQGATLPEQNIPPDSVIDHAWEILCR